MPIYNYEGWTPDYDEVERLVSKLEFRSFGQAAPDLKDDGIGEINLLYRNLVNIRGSWCYYQQEIGDCFDENSFVKMADGSEKKISEVIVGDNVVTPFGNIKKVIRTIKKPYNGIVKKISVEGTIRDIICTPDHKFLNFPNLKGRNPKDRDHYEWKSVNALNVGDRILTPYVNIEYNTDEYFDLKSLESDKITIFDDKFDFVKNRVEPIEPGKIRQKGSHKNINRFIKIDEKIGWLIGLYAAEGSNKDHSVAYNLSIEEKNLAEKVKEIVSEYFGIETNIYSVPSKPSVLYASISSSIFSAFMKFMCSGNTYSKTLNKRILTSSISTKHGVLNGWLDGDGHKGSSGVSVSKDLILDLHNIASSVGISSSIYVRKAYKQSKVAYTLDLNSTEYKEYSYIPIVKKLSKGMTKLGKCPRIKGIEDAELSSPFVYCLEVEDDHSFICNGFAVHNCVSHAFARGLMLLMATEIVHGEKEIYAGDVSSEDIYGGARVYEGRNSLGSQDGCVGVWGASYIQKYGSLLRKVYGSIDLRQYSGKRAKEWGMRGPPRELEEYSRDHTIQSYNLCDSAEEARSAIANGYPVIICSDIGFKDYRDRSGFAVRGSSWSHAMLLVGCDDYSRRKSFIVDNTSWGPNWISGNVPEFCPDLPGGMMPVDWEIVDRMLRQGDSYSISSFNGYKKRKVNFDGLLL